MTTIEQVLKSRADVRGFMFSGHRRLGVFFSADPFQLGIFLSASAILFLLVPAFLVHVALIKDTKASEWPWIGFWQTWNWSVMFPLILPVIFAGTAALSRASYTIFEGLTVAYTLGTTAAVTKKDDRPASDFTTSISEQIAHSERIVFWIVVALTALLTIADTRQLVIGFYENVMHNVAQPFQYLDWTVAFALPHDRFYFYGFPHPGIWGNIAFDVLAYSAQTGAIFLGLFWMGKYWITLNAFTTQLIDNDVDFKFNPWWADPMCRMGLTDVGVLFNGFLVIAALFQIYVLGHRLQLIESSGTPLMEYARDIYKNPHDPAVLWAHRAFTACNPGMWLLLIFVLLPIVVVAWVPLVRFRHYLKAVQRERYRSLRGKLDGHSEDSPEAKEVLRDWDRVNKANIWPNGDFAGWVFLVGMLVLAIAAWFPPGLGYLIVGGGGALLFKIVSSFIPKQTP